VRVKAAQALSLVATSETSQTAFFFLRTFSFCAFGFKKKKWANGLDSFISVGLQRFCKAQFGTPLFFDTKGAKKSSQKKRRVPAGTRGRFLQKAPQKPFWTWRVRTYPSPLKKG